MATQQATRDVSDDTAACAYLIDHATQAANEADNMLANGQHEEAALRLLDASSLYRLAAWSLDRTVDPTGLLMDSPA